MDRVTAHWRGLATREQQFVVAAVVVIILGIFYWGIWSPVSNAERDGIKKLSGEQNTLDYVKQTANKIMSLKQSGASVKDGGSISSIITQSGRKYNLVIKRMQPQDNKIQLWLDDVQFDVLLNFINELVMVKGLSLDSIDLKESDQPGYVQVRRIQLSQ